MEKIGVGGKLPDTLLTHGHTYARSKLIHDEVPDYIEPEDNYEIEAGSAGRVKMTSTQPMTPISESEPAQKSDLQENTQKITPEHDTEPKSSPIQSSTPISIPTMPVVATTEEVDARSEGLSIRGNASNQNPSDDALFALGQFIDQFVREGMVIIASYGEEGRYRLLKLKTLKTDSEIDVKYELDGLDLYQV